MALLKELLEKIGTVQDGYVITSIQRDPRKKKKETYIVGGIELDGGFEYTDADVQGWKDACNELSEGKFAFIAGRNIGTFTR